MVEKLFAEFPPVETSQWEEVIAKDLKGADYEKKLVWKTQEGFSVRPYYRAENLENLTQMGSEPGQFPYLRGIRSNNNWLIRQDYSIHNGVEKANAQALDGLMRGVESLGFCLTKSISKDELSTLLNGIELECVEVNFKGCCLANPEVFTYFLDYVQDKKYDVEKIRVSFDFDPLNQLNLRGHFCTNSCFETLKTIVEKANALPYAKVIGVNAYSFNSAGASSTQELAFALNMGSEYINILTDLGLSVKDVAKKMKFTFGVGSLYFMEIAKFRSARLLWANVVDTYGTDSTCAKKIKIHAVTSLWNQTVYDAYVNMLRNTTEAMSAAIAGVDSLEVLPFDYAFRCASDNEFSNRISRNVQSLLKEEALFDKVVDPSAGSYFIENLTDSVSAAAWDLFKQVEEKGGYIAAMKEGFIQDQIKKVSDAKDQDIEKRRLTILGTNQFPNFLEKIDADVCEEVVKRGAMDIAPEKELVANPIRTYRASQAFEALRYATDKNEKQPQAFMLTFGNLAMCRARAQFSCNFFAVAGFNVVDNNRFETIEEGVKAALEAKAEIIVACSSDDEYPEALPRIAELVGDKAIVVVAGDPACRAELEEKGIKNFINVKCNVLQTLKDYQKMMGINA